MKYLQGIYKIIEKTALSDTCFSFVIDCPEVAKISKAGQFVHILPKGKFLRRPISICQIDYEKGTLRIVYEIRGEGTQELSELNIGDDIDMIAPCGNGFEIFDNAKKIVLVGGGIGTPPMLGLSDIYNEKAVAICGFRNKDAVILEDDFKSNNSKTIICTDDGSYGIKGFVTDSLKAECANGDVDMICACGPTPMLKAVSAIAQENNIECFVSLEERMGCGIGACLVCACKTKDENGEKMSHVCKNGPVFNAKEVVL